MATQVNIFNHEWCELVFVNKNQKYGAFQIRQTSGKRHLIAMLFTLTVIALVLFVTGKKEKGIDTKDLETDRIVDLANFKPPKDDMIRIPENVIQNLNMLRPSMAFIVPIITDDANVTEADSAIHTIEELNNFNGAISNIDVEGNVDGTIIPTRDIVGGTDVDNTIVTYVPQMPHFPGGDEELFKYLKKNLKYPSLPADNGVQGTVYVQFVVFASGEIGNVKVIRGFDIDCEKEAVRVVKSMDNWIPGKQNGKAVNVQMSIPIRFRLEDAK